MCWQNWINKWKWNCVEKVELLFKAQKKSIIRWLCWTPSTLKDEPILMTMEFNIYDVLMPKLQRFHQRLMNWLAMFNDRMVWVYIKNIIEMHVFDAASGYSVLIRELHKYREQNYNPSFGMLRNLFEYFCMSWQLRSWYEMTFMNSIDLKSFTIIGFVINLDEINFFDNWKKGLIFSLTLFKKCL